MDFHYATGNGLRRPEQSYQVLPTPANDIYSPQVQQQAQLFNEPPLSFRFGRNPVQISESYKAQFFNSQLWKEEYQRNNRNGGMKNIRCFPYCGKKHYSTGFCGESLILNVETNSGAQNILAFAEITLLDLSKENIVEGSIISVHHIREQQRTRENPFKDWWPGDLKESKEVVGLPQRKLSFEFNRNKRGWHYGWVANKYISDSKHCVRAYLFVPVNEDFVKCVHVAKSPSFRLFSRKPKRDSTCTDHVEEDVPKTKKIKPATANPNASTDSFVSSPSGAKEEIDVGLDFANDGRSIGSVFFGDELAVEDMEMIVHELSHNALSKKFKGENVFKMLQKLLLLSKEDFNKYIERKSGENAQFQEIIALRAFAAFLLSDDEDVTAVIQANMDKTNPFDESEKPIRKTDDLLKVAKNKFDKFLETFNLNVDLYTQFSEPMMQIQTNTPGTEKQKSETTGNDEEGDVLLPCKKNFIYLGADLFQYLMTVEGHWLSSAETLKAYDNMYNAMEIPYALRKCYISITGSFEMTLERTDDRKKIPSIISQYNPKLFSTGVIKYTFDGEQRPWPLASPLISTKYDAIAVRSYVQKNSQGEYMIVFEHIYRAHKMIRSFHVESCDELTGTVKLYEKWVDFDGSIEWTEIQSNKILFTRSTSGSFSS